MEINSNFEITQQYLNALQNKHSTTNSFADSLTNQTQISKEELLEQLSHISNSDNFNEKISSTAQNMSESDLKLFAFVLNESTNMNYYSPVLLGGKNIDKVNSQESIAITEKFVFNSDEDAIDFIDESLKHLEKSIKNNIAHERDDGEKISREFYSTFENIKTNYIKTIDENNAALGIMTKYTKPISLEEAQKQKEQEQFDTAMKEHGLDPKKNLDVFTFKFMQEGYSKNEAIERTSAYKSAGLIRDTTLEEKFGETIYSLSFITYNPEYKKALEDSFENMTTQQIKGVVKTISSSEVFSIHVDELAKILPRDEEIGPQEVARRMNEYWNDRYGSQEKMSEMFDKLLRQNEINQKFTTDDLTYIEEGLNILIDTYKENNNASK